jgi:hypothetical protein
VHENAECFLGADGKVYCNRTTRKERTSSHKSRTTEDERKSVEKELVLEMASASFVTGFSERLNQTKKE